MGDIVKIELPNLLRDTDRHGNARIYYRRKGQRMIRLHAAPETPEFIEEYRQARDGQIPPARPRAARAAAGSLRWLVAGYYGSANFRTLNPSTQRVRRGLLDAICDSTTKGGAMRGDLPFARIEPRHIRELRDQKLDLPEAANGRVKALRRLFAWGLECDLADRNPAADVTYLSSSGDGYHAWTTEEVRQFELKHPIGCKARLALALLLYTGVRRSDVVKLGRQMERDGALHFIEKKGADSRALGRKKSAAPKRHVLPILPALRAVIDATPSGTLTYLLTSFGRPFTAAGFGNKFRAWCNEAGLPQCSAHGLRKAGATIAAENGATAHQLMALFGWTTIKQAEGYTRLANRERLASEAMHLLMPVSGERKRS
jgi:integrase